MPSDQEAHLLQRQQQQQQAQVWRDGDETPPVNSPTTMIELPADSLFDPDPSHHPRRRHDPLALSGGSAAGQGRPDATWAVVAPRRPPASPPNQWDEHDGGPGSAGSRAPPWRLGMGSSPQTPLQWHDEVRHDEAAADIELRSAVKAANDGGGKQPRQQSHVRHNLMWYFRFGHGAEEVADDDVIHV